MIGRNAAWVGLIVLSTAALSSCGLLVPQTPSEVSSGLVFTQAAQTLVARLTPLPATQTAIATMTVIPAHSDTQFPTHEPLQPTVLPSMTPTPTFGPIPAIPIATAKFDTVCFSGPGGSYEYVSTMVAGEQDTIQGVSKPAGWFYIATPRTRRRSQLPNCWVWSGAVTATGDLATLPVVQAP